MNIPVSYKTLAHYLDGIPNPEKLSSVFLAHICEVEGVETRGEDTIYDLKITPDRGDLLAYRGIAREVSVHSEAVLRAYAPKSTVSEISTKLSVDVRDSKTCARYVGRVVEGVDGRESPAWLREALEASGQRSINAIVDVTNFVMLELGQPMHAFDADKLSREANGEINVIVRQGEIGEKIETLDGKDIVLPQGVAVIADSKRALAIAGVKGGAHAGVGEKVHTVVLEAATFNAAAVRKASSAVNIRTDSSRRFEHNRAPEMAPIAIERATELLLEIFPNAKAGEEVDVYPRPANPYRVSLSAREIGRILGIAYGASDLARDLDRLGFGYERIENPRERIVEQAKKLVGTPYLYGTSVRFDAPRKFDCSGFASYLYLEAGIKIPRISVDQFVFGEPVSLGSLEPGDLVFSYNGGEKVYSESVEWMKGTKVLEPGIDHVGVYLGDGLIAHASRHNKSVGPEGGVLIEKLSESPRFKSIIGVRRIAAIAEERFSIVAPAERFDIRIAADIAEEIARLISYENIPSAVLVEDGFKPSHNDIYDSIIRVRNALAGLGFSEIFTYAFRKNGRVELANPMAEGINFLRDNLTDGMQDALVFNARNAPLLGLDEVLMFEVGTIFLAPEKESLHVSVGVQVTKAMKQSKREERERVLLHDAHKALESALGTEISWVIEGSICEGVIPPREGMQTLYEPLAPSSMHTAYSRISAYPFMLRDIAVWAEVGIFQEEIISIIQEEAGVLLVRDRLFDVFEKDFDGVKKTSYAFNLVFQSYDRTLTDVEVNEIMARITAKLIARGLEVR